MLKVGDKLLCKKTSYNIKKGKYYSITNINVYVYINNIVHFDGIEYSLDQNDIWKFFYTPQEVRKMKLKQLLNEK